MQQQQQHTRAHTPTRIAYSLLYVFVRHPTTKCVWHNNHESRQRLWTPISKSCDSFLFTFAPDVRRRHLWRSRLTNTHTYSQPHAQTPTVYPTVVADLQRETKRNQREHKNESERPQTKQSRTNVGSRTVMGERTTESVSGRQRERERRQRCLCCCCCCCCWPREGAPLTCTLTSNTEQSNSYRQYSRTHPHTHIDPPHCIFWRTWRASKYLPNVCWVYCPRFTFANLRTRRKEEERDKERSELTVTKARPQWKCFLFSAHRGNLYIFVYVSVSLRVFVFVPTSRVHVQLPIGLAGVVSVCLCICLYHPLSLWVMCTWAIAMKWRYICREYTLSVHRHVLISSNCYKYTTHY